MDEARVFIEFGVDDAAAAGPFLGGVLGWTFHPAGKGGWFETPGGRAGMHGADGGQVYVYHPVPDLDAAMARVLAGGGTAETQGPGDDVYGRFADCSGPGGLKFGIYQAPRSGKPTAS